MKDKNPYYSKIFRYPHCSMVISLNYYCIDHSIYEGFKHIIEEPMQNRNSVKTTTNLSEFLEKQACCKQSCFLME